MNVIDSGGLTKIYGNLKALDNLSFNIEENKITGLIGRNGSGKTTLLKLIAGFLHKTSGELKVFSENPFNSIKVSSNMIFIDDNMSFPASLHLVDILEAAGSFYDNWDAGLANGLFDYFGLNPRQPHSNLSKGMKSTFNMIIGLSARCPLTIFDEPTTGMDVAVRKDFYRALLKDYLQNPRTIIISSHLLNEVEHVLEDILLLGEGQKRIHIPVEELREFAIGLKGKTDIVQELATGKEVYHRENFGKDSTYVVVKNDFSEGRLQNAKLSGIEIIPVTTDDLCVFLTSRNKGGIDDVFNRN